MEFVFAFIFVIAFAIGGISGYASGKSNLCEKQFQGEMHKDKCVKVQREELK